jgi:hypothetical protein
MHTVDLSPVLDHAGPFATVLVEVSHETEHGAQEHETRVRDAARALAEQGAPPAVVDAVRERLAEAPGRPSPVARLVVGTADGIVYDDTVSTHVDRPVASWHPLPDLAAWVRERDAAVPFVLVLVDHEGADLSLWSSAMPTPELEVEAGGDTSYVHKVKTGDIGDYSVQRSTEEVWRHNADAAAGELERLVRAHGHPLVLVAGDPQSVSMLTNSVDGLPAEVVTLPTGQRSEDGGDAALHAAIGRAVLDHVVRRRTELTHRLRDALGRGEGAVTGVRDVADALRQGQVERLLIDPDPAAGLELDPAAHPGLTWGSSEVAGPVRADEALIAAAIATDAEVSVLPAAALGGTPVAALLRWA